MTADSPTLTAPDTPTNAPGRDRIDTALRGAVIGLVGIVAAIAFVASFEAISQYAVRVGAFPPDLWWAAPLLVDTFIVAGSLAALRRARAKQWAIYPWALVAAGTAVSVTLNVAHAPPTLPARLVSALPSTALLASFELLLAEARRTGRYESVMLRAWRAIRQRPRKDRGIPARRPTQPLRQELPAAPPPRREPEPSLPSGVETAIFSPEPQSGARSGESREAVRRLLEDEGPGVTRARVMEVAGVGSTRAGQLLREEKAKRNGSIP